MSLKLSRLWHHDRPQNVLAMSRPMIRTGSGARPAQVARLAARFSARAIRLPTGEYSPQELDHRICRAGIVW